MLKKINKMNNGSIINTFKIYKINNRKLRKGHSGYKLFIKIDENHNGITILPMINSQKYDFVNNGDYILEIIPDNINKLKSISYINCASEVYFINKQDCVYLNKIGELSQNDLLNAQNKIIHALINNHNFETICATFDKTIQ